MQTTMRILLTASDIMIIFKCSQPTAYRTIARIKRKFNKVKDECLSMDDFCAYTGLMEHKVNQMLDDPIHSEKILSLRDANNFL